MNNNFDTTQYNYSFILFSFLFYDLRHELNYLFLVIFETLNYV